MKTEKRNYYSKKVNGEFIESDTPTQIVTCEYEFNNMLMRSHMVGFMSNANTETIEVLQETEALIGGIKVDGVWTGGTWTIQVNSNQDSRTIKVATAKTSGYVDLVTYMTTGVMRVVKDNEPFVVAEYDEEGVITNAELIGTIKEDAEGNPLYINEVKFYCGGIMPSLQPFLLSSLRRTQEIG